MNKYLSEFLGTFLFVLVILHVTSNKSNWPNLTPLLIVVGLLAAISISASSSGGHLNPAVSTVMALNGSLPMSDYLPYIGSQLLGAVTAKLLFDQMV